MFLIGAQHLLGFFHFSLKFICKVLVLSIYKGDTLNNVLICRGTWIIDEAKWLPDQGFCNAGWRAVLPVDKQGDRDAALLPKFVYDNAGA
ncbi:hypothetical protein [Limnobacter sp. UBA3528]|jgi:hypothetical protein|uniref:hypothetical protein n=1 Tax=Limnobacter sp. UBA3528 TaxID=1946760 RepID=UPI0025C39DF7|nr:hypothetical protein [Limnobacter sp. UBA3528]|tara:strand:+ start:162 stop:431 length:270 start_codon:yes stop_codon:yes gene_type:complete